MIFYTPDHDESSRVDESLRILPKCTQTDLDISKKTTEIALCSRPPITPIGPGLGATQASPLQRAPNPQSDASPTCEATGGCGTRFFRPRKLAFQVRILTT